MNTLLNLRAGAVAGAAVLAALAATPAQAQSDGNWSGFYAGVQVGGARERLRVAATDTVTQYTNIDPPGVEPISIVPGTTVTLAGRGHDSSITYGGLVGWQFQSGQMVFGLEGDLRSGRSSVDTLSTLTLPLTLLAPSSNVTVERHAKSRFEWSARARLGVASGSTLFYGTGGLAGTHVRLRANSSYTIPAGNAGVPAQPFPAEGPFLVSGSGSGNLLGWTGGLGIEQRLGAHVRIGIEGRYTDYGSKNVGITNATQTSAGAPSAAPFTARSGEGVYPGSTRVSLRDAQVALRLTFAF
jgi:opacity protein-like surface antigen